MFDIDASILDDRKDEIPIPVITIEQLSPIQDPEFLSLQRYKTCLVQFTVLHDDNITVRRFTRTGQEDVCIRNSHPSYRVCTCEWSRILRERELKMSEDVHLSGPMQDMTHEEFMRVFNLDAPDADLEGVLKNAFCIDKTPVGELKRMAHTGNPEEREKAYSILAERIHILETIKNFLTVRIHKDKTVQYDIIEDAKEDERKKLREHDKKYKPKPVAKPEDKKATVRKSQEQKMRDTLRALAPADVKKDPKALEDWIDKFIVANRNKG